MLYMFLLYTEPGSEFPADGMERHFAVAAEARRRGAYVCSEALGNNADTATTVRVRDGRTLTSDGPFAETKEVLGGFYILDCEDLDDAIAYAEKIPDAHNGSVEIRPVLHVPGWEYATGAGRGRASMGGG